MVCKQKTVTFSRTVSQYQCITKNTATHEACKTYAVKDGKVTCNKKVTLNRAETCNKFAVNAKKDNVKCTEKVQVWPRGKCTSTLTFKGVSHCSEFVYQKPMFFCKKYTVLSKNKFCVEMMTFFGQKSNSFICVKTGVKSNQKLSSNGLSGNGKPTCLEYKQVENTAIKSLTSKGGNKVIAKFDGRVLS